jgi:hypothetical protein
MTDLDWPNEALNDPKPDEKERNRLRSARKRDVRASTLSLQRIPKRERAQRRQQEPDDGRRRLPLTRGECEQVERPCPFISCKWHLFLDVDRKNGSIKFNYPDLLDHTGAPELEYLSETCALDIADRGGITLEVLGEILNVTRERARQLEVSATARLERHPLMREINDGYEPFDTESIFDNPYADADEE